MSATSYPLPCGCAIEVEHTSGQRLVTCGHKRQWVVAAAPARPSYLVSEYRPIGGAA